MITWLSWVTTFVNVVGLACCLGLSFYIVTRTPHSRRSWLAALALWALACLFVYNALALNHPEGRTVRWLRPVALLVLPLWFHTTLMLPPTWRQPRFRLYLPPMRLPEILLRRLGHLSPLVSRAGVPLAYGLALALLIGNVFPLGQLPKAALEPAVLLSERIVDPLFPLSIAFLLVLGSLALVHLWQGLQDAQNLTQRRQHDLLLTGTILAGIGGLYTSLGLWLQLPLPAFAGDALVVAAAFILGYVVAEHNALIEGRTIKRDLSYIALAIGALAALCVVIAELLYLSGHVFSLLTLIVIIVVAISCLMLYDGVRTALDRLFYHQQFRQLRANLRALAREAGTGQSLQERLQAMLEALRGTLAIQQSFLALRTEDAFVCEATERAVPVGRAFPLPILSAPETIALPRPDGASPEGMALLVPLYYDDNQIGALVLGSKEASLPYTDDDLLLLDDVADQLAMVIRDFQLQEESAEEINRMVSDFRQRERALQRQVQQMLAEREQDERPILDGIGEKEFISLVEDALRQLHDFSYLGEHTLAQLHVVKLRLKSRGDDFSTHIDRGKAVSEIVLQALGKLRPASPEPAAHTIPAREWTPFITLYDAYVLDVPNRDIMSRLYISEGTFNRTRRRALRGVAKALREMEQEAQREATT
jgi:hypothetical protein